MSGHDAAHGPPAALDAVAALQAHPRWYFRSGAFSVPEMLALLVSEATDYGSRDLSIVTLDGWWVVSSQHDWLEGDVSPFLALVPDSRSGRNAARIEVILTAFCLSVWTSFRGSSYDVTASGAPPASVHEILADGSTGRAIAFLPPRTAGGEGAHDHDRASSGSARAHLRLIQSDSSSRLDQALSAVQRKESALLEATRLGDPE